MKEIYLIEEAFVFNENEELDWFVIYAISDYKKALAQLRTLEVEQIQNNKQNRIPCVYRYRVVTLFDE